MERPALIISNSVSALIEVEAMKAANEERRGKGQADAYGEEAFWELKDRHEKAIAALW